MLAIMSLRKYRVCYWMNELNLTSCILVCVLNMSSIVFHFLFHVRIYRSGVNLNVHTFLISKRLISTPWHRDKIVYVENAKRRSFKLCVGIHVLISWVWVRMCVQIEVFAVLLGSIKQLLWGFLSFLQFSHISHFMFSSIPHILFSLVSSSAAMEWNVCAQRYSIEMCFWSTLNNVAVSFPKLFICIKKKPYCPPVVSRESWRSTFSVLWKAGYYWTTVRISCM